MTRPLKEIVDTIMDTEEEEIGGFLLKAFVWGVLVGSALTFIISWAAS